MEERTRKQYSREFKEEAARLMRESGKGPSQLARELGIRRELLRNWKQQYEAAPAPEEAFPGHGQLSAGEAEIRRLRRENEVLRQERDFLKKAAAYFAKEPR